MRKVKPQTILLISIVAIFFALACWEDVEIYLTGVGSIGDNGKILNVPCYIWHHGCTPTAFGMVLGYYDNNVGTNFLGNEPLESIASTEHYNDYSLPMDTEGAILQDSSVLGNAHPNNCIADYMKTSFSSENCHYGLTMLSNMCPGIESYSASRGKPCSTNLYANQDNATFYNLMKDEINSGRPLVATVFIEDLGHSITAVGWRENSGLQEIGYYDTYENDIQWKEVTTEGDWRVSYVIAMDFGYGTGGFDDGSGIPGFELPLLILSFVCVAFILWKRK